jgi:hypothetical protein
MAVALPALLAAAVYVGTLANGLVYDDPLAMARGHESLGDLIGRRNGLTYLTVSLDHRLWGAWIPGFHLTNVFLHALASALVALCARMLGGRGGQQGRQGAAGDEGVEGRGRVPALVGGLEAVVLGAGARAVHARAA